MFFFRILTRFTYDIFLCLRLNHVLFIVLTLSQVPGRHPGGALRCGLLGEHHGRARHVGLHVPWH